MGRPVLVKDLAWFLARGKRTGTGCLEWIGAKDRRGYGTSTTYNKTFKVHRRVYFLRYGEEPDMVCHSCDNPPCFEPAHLFGGKAADNNRDKAAKGRARSRAFLTHEQAMEIRARRLAGEVGSRLAEEFNVTPQTVCDISKGRSWTTYVPTEGLT